jgi:TRAP-type C4-dicarboxylate transport system permease small subunit
MSAPDVRRPPGPLARALALLDAICIALLLAMCAILIFQVFARNILSLTPGAADELSLFAQVSLVYLATPALLQRRRHIRVEVVLNLLPDLPRRKAELVIDALVLVFALCFLWSAGAFLTTGWRSATPSLGLPNWIVFTPIVVGLGLTAVVGARQLIEDFRGLGAPPGTT